MRPIHCARSIRAAFVVAILLVPTTASAAVTNRAEVHPGDGAAAVCQLLLLARAVILFELEDGLALVTPARAGPVRLPLAGAVGGEPVEVTRGTADCRILVGALRVHFPGEPEAARRGAYASGPVAVGGTADPFREVDIETGPGSAVACQVVVIVDSILVGGAALGLPPGSSKSLVFRGTTGDADTHARCETAVADVVVTW